MIHIRWMIRRDMPEVMEIERHSFDDPWTEEECISVLRQRSCIGMVAEDGAGGVLGFMIYEFLEPSIQILNFAVHRGYRRQGVATALIDKLKGKLSPERRTRLQLQVREANLDAQLFYRSQGFRAVAVLNDYYINGETAYQMEYELAETVLPTNRVNLFFKKST